jgi:hypothetical protein
MTFDERVRNAIREMIGLGYRPQAFMGMIFQYDTIEAVKRLINSTRVPDGFVRLWELKRLDLSMENIIQEPEGHNLFTDEEREMARKRLAAYEYSI